MRTTRTNSRLNPSELRRQWDCSWADPAEEMVSGHRSIHSWLIMLIHSPAMRSSSRSQCCRRNSSESALDGSISRRLSASINKLEAKKLTRESLDSALTSELMGAAPVSYSSLMWNLRSVSKICSEASRQAVVRLLAALLLPNWVIRYARNA